MWLPDFDGKAYGSRPVDYSKVVKTVLWTGTIVATVVTVVHLTNSVVTKINTPI